MFTGIVTHRGLVERADLLPSGALTLEVQTDPPLVDVTQGASVAVDGVCLTVVAASAGRLRFDVVPETLRRTTLAAWAPGTRTNVERALRVGDELGGHWVQGHVDGVATVVEVTHRGADVRVVVALPPELAGSALPKGSLTVNGVSLTVGEVWRAGDAERLSLYLIPHTLAVTTLSALSVGAHVNVEADALGRWIARAVAASAQRRPDPA